MSTNKALKFFFRSTGAGRHTMAAIFAVSIVSAAVNALMSMTLLPLVDTAMLTKQGIDWRYAVIFIAATVLNGVLKYTRKMGYSAISADCEQHISKKLTGSLLDKDISYFEKNKEGEMAALIGKRIRDYKNFISENLENFIFEPFNFLFIFIGVLIVDARVGLVIICVILISAWIHSKFGNRVAHSAQKAYEAQNDVMGYQKEIIEDYENIRMGRIVGYILHTYHKKSEASLDVQNALTKENQRAYIPALLNEYIPTIILLLTAIVEVPRHQMSYGVFAAMLALINGISLPFTNYLRSFTKLKRQVPFMQKIMEVYNDTESACQDNTPALQSPASQAPLGYSESTDIVKLSQVTFQYMEMPEILHNIDINIKKNEKIAIIGESGCGKSTLLKLILGFYKPASGTVEVFGKQAFLNQSSIWEHTAYVDNENFLFDGDLTYNITLLERRLTREENKRYLHICASMGIDKFTVENGSLEQFGKNLSGGQRLKVSLARALFSNAKLLILDEPTASFDTEAEEVLCHLLNAMEAAVILTTHRMKLLQSCDRVYKLDNRGLRAVKKGAGGRKHDESEKNECQTVNKKL